MTDNEQHLLTSAHVDALHEVIRLNPYPHIDRRLLIDIEMYLRATLMAPVPTRTEQPLEFAGYSTAPGAVAIGYYARPAGYVTPPEILTWADSPPPFADHTTPPPVDPARGPASGPARRAAGIARSRRRQEAPRPSR